MASQPLALALAASRIGMRPAAFTVAAMGEPPAQQRWRQDGNRRGQSDRPTRTKHVAPGAGVRESRGAGYAARTPDFARASANRSNAAFHVPVSEIGCWMCSVAMRCFLTRRWCRLAVAD